MEALKDRLVGKEVAPVAVSQTTIARRKYSILRIWTKSDRFVLHVDVLDGTSQPIRHFRECRRFR